MRFICQIAIDSAQFSPVSARMAYLFVTDEEDNAHVDGTWEPDGGENAVILQPGTTTIKTMRVTEGPSLHQMVKKWFLKFLVPEPCEFSAVLKPGEDPDFVEDEAGHNWSKEEQKSYYLALDGNKIGGSPMFVLNAEFPGPGRWRLLLQLDSTKVPFFVNFGDAGIGYLFLSDDGKTAKFLWQCC